MENKKILASVFSLIRAKMKWSEMDAARKMRLQQVEYQRLENSSQAMRAIKYLFGFAEEAGIRPTELKKMVDESEMPRIEKAPKK